MASERGSLSPSDTGTRVYRVYSTNLSSNQHTSFPSHMTRPSFPMPSMNFNIGTPGYSRESKPTAEDNVQSRFELFLLGEGEKKVTEEADTRVHSASKFTFNKEDHTLGNLLRSRLLQSPHVTFSGYKVPHPLVSQFELRVQTDGTITPRAALMQCCKDLVNDLGILNREFIKEYELRKMVGDGAKTDEKKDDKRLGR